MKGGKTSICLMPCSLNNLNAGSKKRKASSYYARTEAIGLSTPRVSYKDEDPLSSSDFSVGESQSSTVGSQLSSQVRHLEILALN